jgi:hypothetical protein
MSKTFLKKIDKNFDVSFSSICFARGFGCFSALGVQKHYKTRFAKKSSRKVFTKKSTKNPKPTFSRFVFNHVFGSFLVRGVQKHHLKKNRKKKSDPGPFLASDPPTHHGGHRFLLFWRPLDADKAQCASARGYVAHLAPGVRHVERRCVMCSC